MRIDQLYESHQQCPECGGPAFSDLLLAEKKDACYSKVRSRYKVWPSAYASGALVQCRKKGAANWGNKSESVNEAEPVPGKYSGHFYDARILPNGDYEVVKINSKTDEAGVSNPLNLSVGDVVPRSQAHALQYRSDGGMFDQLKDMEEGIFGNMFGGTARTAPGQLKTYAVYDGFTVYYDPAKEMFVTAGTGEYKDQFRAKGFPALSAQGGVNTAIAYGEKMTGGKSKQPISMDRSVMGGAHESVAEGETDLNWLRDVSKEKLDALAGPRYKKQSGAGGSDPKKKQQHKGGMDLATLRAAAKSAKPASELNEYNAEYDDEAGMADNNLETLKRAVEGIDDLIQTGDNLPEWCQEKIANAKSMLVAVWDYMYSEEASDEVDPEVDEMFEAMQQLVSEMARKNRVSEDLVWESFEALPDNVLYETAAWRRKEGKSAKGGLNAKGVASYRRENPGSKLQMAVTTKPSKLKPGSKAAKRRKSFCARMSGVKGPMKKPNGKPTRKALALRKWNC